MRVLERGGQYKKETDYQLVPKAPITSCFVPVTTGVDVLFGTVRQRRARTVRGI
jgi:hypothetical protein